MATADRAKIQSVQPASASIILRHDALHGAHAIDIIASNIAACKGTLRSNCAGTGFYITGIQYADERYSTFLVYRSVLSRLKKIPEPVVGCLVAWFARSKNIIEIGGVHARHIITYHLGVVAPASTSTDGLLIANRLKADGPFFPDQPFSEINRKYAFCKYGFYLPECLAAENRKIE